MMSYDQIFRGSAPKETEETVELAGRSLACRRIDHEATLHGQEFRVSFWTSDHVPGGLVKSEARFGTGHATKTTVTAFEKKGP